MDKRGDEQPAPEQDGRDMTPDEMVNFEQEIVQGEDTRRAPEVPVPQAQPD